MLAFMHENESNTLTEFGRATLILIRFAAAWGADVEDKEDMAQFADDWEDEDADADFEKVLKEELAKAQGAGAGGAGAAAKK